MDKCLYCGCDTTGDEEFCDRVCRELFDEEEEEEEEE